MQNSFKTNYKIRNKMVHWNFIKNLKKQAKQWKTDKKTGKQENGQKTRKNRKTGSVGTLHLSLHYVILLFRNSTNFVEVNTPKINENAPMAKLSKCEKT